MKELSKLQTKILLVSVFTLMLILPAYGKEPKWYSNFKQINLMTTTKQSIEELFDQPKVIYVDDAGISKNVDYKIKEGRLSAYYSKGKCAETNSDFYDVEKDIVIGITLYLEKEVSYTKLKINLNNYDKREISDLVGVSTYVNDETGEWFNGTSEKLNDFKLFPTKKQERLRCKKL